MVQDFCSNVDYTTKSTTAMKREDLPHDREESYPKTLKDDSGKLWEVTHVYPESDELTIQHNEEIDGITMLDIAKENSNWEIVE
jgi:hypothetical protein